MPEITEYLLQAKINAVEVYILENVKLADPTYHKSESIDMLFEAEVYWSIFIRAPEIGSKENQFYRMYI